MIPDAARAMWAKTDRSFRAMETTAWLSLPQHLSDTQVTAGWLWDYHLTRPLRAAVAAGYGCSEDTARSIYVFAAALHDVGKAASRWSWKYAAIGTGETWNVIRSGMHDAGIDHINAEESAQSFFQHEEWSAALIRHWAGCDTLPRLVRDSIATAVAGHHSRVVDMQRVTTAQHMLRTDSLSAERWVDAALSMCEHFYLASGLSRATDMTNTVGDQVTALLTQLVILADHLASNELLFPYTSTGTDIDGGLRYERARGLITFGPSHRATGGVGAVVVSEMDVKFPLLFSRGFTR